MDRIPVEDDEGNVILAPKGEKENPWIVLAAFLSMISGIFHAVHEFFECMSMTATSRYMWNINRRRFFEEASKQIEEITDAPSAATSWSLGTRGSE